MDQITGGLQSIIANYGMKLLLAIILLLVGNPMKFKLKQRN